MDQLTLLLEKLNIFSPISAKKKEGKLEKISRKASKYLIISIIVLFFLILALVGWHRFISPLSEIFITIAHGITIIAILLPISYMAFDILIGVWSIINLKKRSYKWLILEIQHDKEAINELVSFDEELLKEAKQWLELKCSRMKNRISTFLGSSEKYALFSLMGLGWAAYKELSKTIDVKTTGSSTNFLLTGDPTHDIFLLGVAFLTGVFLGAMIVNYQVQRYTYLIELLDFSLKEKQKNSISSL
ncbi:hypothetical protein MWMV2_MWMV2_03333 [Acinetobacter oleivorans]|nr:hypothetical protein MWMV3_MWMV3_03200 [Acinetobacter oleivorans]CAI3161600.1 hypothetical protein MWMV12_MWMV12_03333 [Acinetobacter oleivorans]CAI3161655.1 hypothetical protein MWMV13_MWMV13_03335 [Acinetobacter oleivorans]CAI3161669.1 hypothetical protein MWMV5_MWMV5_03334 [Acinetobacter oleivorans]CAI3161675.1 hypothetical protein MWMV2_MWMV2_03333 [Acinetobacter oleivorans]